MSRFRNYWYDTISAGWAKRITARKDSAVWPVLTLLASRPLVNAAVLEFELSLDYMRMKRAMDTLTKAGIVVGVDKFKRDRFLAGPGNAGGCGCLCRARRKAAALGGSTTTCHSQHRAGSAGANQLSLCQDRLWCPQALG